MRKMFNGCNSLTILPDISKWNTSKVTNFTNILNDCNSLVFLPDLSKWNFSETFHKDKLLDKIGCFNALNNDIIL